MALISIILKINITSIAQILQNMGNTHNISKTTNMRKSRKRIITKTTLLNSQMVLCLQSILIWMNNLGNMKISVFVHPSQTIFSIKANMISSLIIDRMFRDALYPKCTSKSQVFGQADTKKIYLFELSI